MTRNEFKALTGRSILRLDGATGTELVKRGMPPGVSPEAWVLEHPAAIQEVQRAYAAAGSDIVYIPCFGGNPLKLQEFGLDDRTEEINARLARISREALPDTLIFGDIAPTGHMFTPLGDLDFEDAVTLYKRQIAGLLESGCVDGFAIETMMDLQEARAALLAVRELCDLPVIVTLTFEPGGRTLTGTHPVSALVTLQSLGADAFGCNCSTGPAEMAQIIRALKPYANIPLVAKANAGIPRLVDGETCFDLGPEDFARGAEKLVDAGAGLVGGCCGTTPAHIAALHRLLGDRKPVPVQAEKSGVIASSREYRRIPGDEPFTVVGERINPTGKKALQAELRAGDLDLVCELAREQVEQGATVLDVNFGLSGIDEADTMRRAVTELVMTTGAPLCIDSTSPEAVEAALRIYPGRALFNSVSCEASRLREILPIAARYGAMLVLLPLTDQGIPETVPERLEVLNRIMQETAQYGYTPADYVVDALVMTVSANPEAARISLDFIDICRREVGVATICGLSNVSFGLPNRPLVNKTFLGMAMGYGLTAAIANPGAPGLMDAVAAGDALNGLDPHMERYLVKFGAPVPANASPSTSAPPAPSTAAPSPVPPSTAVTGCDSSNAAGLPGALYEAVLTGKKELALQTLDELLAAGSVPPGDIVNKLLIPAITEVGERFERKEYYLPQLMQSASAMQKAMEKLRPLLKSGEGAGEDAPVFILATVKGDIHDIGKNIVALLLENHNFKVIDLGKDVEAETIVEAAIRHKAAFIGLSALMTTTMPQMKVVMELARQRGLEIPVLVGGAAVDEYYAASIQAVYGADAMAAVRNAMRLWGRGEEQ